MRCCNYNCVRICNLEIDITMKTYDIAIIGGGIVGTATALALTSKHDVSVAVIEAEKELAHHQSGRNSGVIHSGIYYKPGSLKARLCTEGREAMYDFCAEHNIAHERCGKVVVATKPEELDNLQKLMERAKENGVKDIEWLDRQKIAEYEPHAAGLAGLFVPVTGIVDYIAVVKKYAELVQANGGEILLNSRVTQVRRGSNEIILTVPSGKIKCRNLINCAGLYSDRVARMAGLKPPIQIIPFRGEYYVIRKEKRHLVKNLIYPVPDPRFPFLGVHFTRRVDGLVEAGPNAVLALSREAYDKTDFSLFEMANMALYGGFWKMARKFWQTGLGEYYRSFSKSAFTDDLKRLLPDLKQSDIKPGGSGIRAQALDQDGSLIDDFYFAEDDDMVHVLNAPSPAATASLKIGEYIADKAKEKFKL